MVIAIGAVVAAGATVAGSAMSANAAENAAETQASAAGRAADAQLQGTKMAIAEQQRQFDITQSHTLPWRSAGIYGLNRMEQGLRPGGEFAETFGRDDFRKDPGYQFRLAEGAKALERSAASRGMSLSGAQLKDLTRYNQGFASNEYGNAFNRFQTQQGNRFNRFASLAGVGQTAVNTLTNVGQNTANNIGEAAMAGGNARASGYINAANASAAGQVGAANAWNQGMSGVGNSLNTYLMMRQFAPPAAATAPASGFTPAYTSAGPSQLYSGGGYSPYL